MHDTAEPTMAAASLTFSFDPTTACATLATSTMTLSSTRGRFWTLTATYGDERDIAVHSEQQTSGIVLESNPLRIHYPTLIAAGGNELPVALTVVVDDADGALGFSADITGDAGVVVREISLPVIELAADTAHADETVIRAEGLGRRISSPRTALYRAHTEYMLDDGAGVWERVAYPGEMSMPWQGVELPDGFLYVGRHDPEFASSLFNSGVPPRGEAGELWLTVTTTVGRQRGHVGRTVIALEDGWEGGAQRYRAWADASWYTGPHPDARPMHGWQRLIMKHQFGEVYLRYDQLVDAYETGTRYGLDGILLFGWWKAGFDRGYPVYEVDERLGTADELRAAIREIRSRGGYIALYANGNLIDRRSDFQREHGYEVAKKDSYGLDYVVGYDFAGESQTLRHFSTGAFTIACHGSALWRETMASVGRVQADLGADEVFFDQTAFHLAAWPCYDESHEHGDRVGIESTYRAQTLDAIRAASGAVSLGSEGMSDIMIGKLNYHHGWGFAFADGPEAYPAVFRTVFPEPYVSNRLIHDLRPGWRDQLNYALVNNLIFDVAIHRCRATIDTIPEYAEHVGTLTAIRREHERFFTSGTYRQLAHGDLTHVRLTVGDESLDLRWNRTDEPIVADGTSTAPHSVSVVHTGIPA